MQNKHWTGHQGRMQPPLTGAYKTMLVISDSSDSMCYGGLPIFCGDDC